MMKLLDVFRRCNFGRWYEKGLNEGWLTYGCMQHNPPMTDDFLEEFNEKFENGDDPCLHVFMVSPDKAKVFCFDSNDYIKEMSELLEP